MGNQRGESAGEVLPADGGGEGPTCARERSVVATRARDWTHYESGAEQRVTSMKPDMNELDEEIRGHMALSIKERIERGEDPEAARRAALRELGYVPADRDAMRRVGESTWYDEAEATARNRRVAFR